MNEFLYKGKPIYELKSVEELGETEEQLLEIEARLKALRIFCLANDIIITPKHIKNVLALSKQGFRNATKGLVNSGGTAVKVENTNFPEEKKKFIKGRALLLQSWLDYAEQWVLDTCAATTKPIGAIYISKSIFQNWDSPQEKKENKIGIEVLLKKETEAKQ